MKPFDDENHCIALIYEKKNKKIENLESTEDEGQLGSCWILSTPSGGGVSIFGGTMASISDSA